MSFKALKLHDSLISKVELDWDSGKVSIYLHAFLTKNELAESCVLIFTDVAFFSVTRTLSWGYSNLILEVGENDDGFWIEIQSGDKIVIKASKVELVKNGL